MGRVVRLLSTPFCTQRLRFTIRIIVQVCGNMNLACQLRLRSLFHCTRLQSVPTTHASSQVQVKWYTTELKPNVIGGHIYSVQNSFSDDLQWRNLWLIFAVFGQSDFVVHFFEVAIFLEGPFHVKFFDIFQSFVTPDLMVIIREVVRRRPSYLLEKSHN